MGRTENGLEPKNLVVCCDGTGKAFGHCNTNVVGLFDAVHKDDLFSAMRKQREGETAQLAFYDPGVGSLRPNARFTVMGRLGMAISKAFGTGFRLNLLDGYRFLMGNYHRGDRVFLYGFSRGAYTVRWLAGIIHKVGLLHRGNENLLDYALEVALDEGNDAVAAGFKDSFSRECKPQVVGVWDTVSSLGFLSGRRFPNLRLNPDVAHAFQALSIDERRRKFPAVLWDERHVVPGQEILQVWFPGDHSDVGGGHVVDSGLSQATLLWMLEHSRRCGLIVSDDVLEGIRAKVDPAAESHDLYRGWWRLLGYELREVPRGSNLHVSVRQRMEARRDYRPGMLPGPDRLGVDHRVVDTPRSTGGGRGADRPPAAGIAEVPGPLPGRRADPAAAPAT